MRRLLSFVSVLALCAPLAFAMPAYAIAQTYDQNLYSGLQWRLIGPFRGGRALAVAGIAGNDRTFYFGAVGGGVWRTDNAGRTWAPVFDSQPVASIGAIAVAPSDPNVIYVGSGEADMRSDIQAGNGMYKSTDGGKTWRHIGLDDTVQIGKIIVDPKDANVAYVAALGHQYGPNAERGVFKTTDGGQTWTKVLYKDENTGAIDLSMSPSDPNVLFAALWQTRRPPWNVYPPSSGPGSGLYKTSDGGKTWAHVSGHGFPEQPRRIGIAISPANANRVYALVDTKEGGVYRSDDGGATWTHTDGEQRIWQRGWYFGGITADPKNADIAYVMDTSTYRTTDGGKTFDAIKGAPGGDDYHTLWIDPTDSDRMILGSDQGVIISVDGAKTWSSWYNQPTGQMYHVSVDDRFPYWIYGAQQDSGGVAIVSRSRHAGIGERDWLPIDAPGESGYAAPDPLHPGKLFGSNPLTEEDVDFGFEQNVDAALTQTDTIERNTWTLPVVFSPADPHALYASHQQVFRSANGGKSWSPVSPDLTRKTLTVPKNLDASTAEDNTGLTRRGVVYTVAPSPLRKAVIWAGTDDGLVWLTSDGGARWQNVTPPALTPWSKVGIIDASHFDAKTAYAAIDRHRLDDRTPYIYRTHDGGAHWTLVTSGIPKDSFVNVVREDPVRRGLLYAGTETGVFVSFDDGARWQSLQLNLPSASIRDIAFRNGDIVLATHGRAFWALDNATPLREIAQAAQGATYLYKPLVTHRTRPGSDEGTPLSIKDEPMAANPPNGVLLDYYLHGAATVTLAVIDAHGNTVRHWASSDKPKAKDPRKVDIPGYWLHPELPPSGDPGEHRFVWDFKYTDGVLAPPGIYTVRLTANGRSVSQRLTLERDPRIHASDADLREQFAFAESIEAAQAQVKQAQAEVAKRLKSATNAAARARLAAIAGVEPPSDPDDSVGKPSYDFTSLRFLAGAFDNLEGAVESGDNPPSADARIAFGKLQGTLHTTLAQLRTVK
ncbi:MAG: VPS10 domain-containing protein [Vulcanimicrobiaceae bacterium]